MTTETREEIMKALAYGLDPTTVAQCNGVTVVCYLNGTTLNFKGGGWAVRY